MTDNLKKFLEEASKDQEFIEKVNGTHAPEALIALAAEKGFALTAEDLKPDQPTGELSEDELDAVAGGSACACISFGLGEKEKADKQCICYAAGAGKGVENKKEVLRCGCATIGGGESKND